MVIKLNGKYFYNLSLFLSFFGAEGRPSTDVVVACARKKVRNIPILKNNRLFL